MTSQRLNSGDIVGGIADIFERRGAEAYLGEAVTVAEHMLQTAMLAQAEDAPDVLVAAALLHDIGHFTSEFGAYSPEDTIDRLHDEAGAKVLEGVFPPAVHGVRPPSCGRQTLSLRHRPNLLRQAFPRHRSTACHSRAAL